MPTTIHGTNKAAASGMFAIYVVDIPGWSVSVKLPWDVQLKAPFLSRHHVASKPMPRHPNPCFEAATT